MSDRGAWSSKIGFILAGAGSAIGLGAIWRFPYMTGDNGGALFVILFLICCFFIGYPVMIAELSLGRNTEKNPVGMFRKLTAGKGRIWKMVGGLCVLSGFTIFSWYSVIAGWVLGYFYKTVSGAFNTVLSNEAIDGIFDSFVGNAFTVMSLHALVIFMTGFVVYRGVKAGIETLSKWLMPLLFVLLILLAFRSVTLEGAGEGLRFYLYPDFSKFSGIVILKAMGQALFSLSLGMGTMITYGSYLSKNESIYKSAAWITFFEILVCILAGFVILPAVAAMNQSYAQGPDLIFKVLPSIFASMPGGYFFGIGFFVLIIIAAITSTVSILEVPVAYFVDEKKWNRSKSVFFVGFIAWLIGTPAALSSGASEFWSSLPGIGLSFFDIISTAFGDISLSIGAFFIAIFVAWKWGVDKASEEIESDGNTFKIKAVWGFLIRYVAPITIFIVFANVIWGTFFGD
ncbi:sodium-dependent transporter [candidate division KSB1 bacterium]